MELHTAGQLGTERDSNGASNPLHAARQEPHCDGSLQPTSAGPEPQSTPLVREDGPRMSRLVSTPPLNRRSMAPAFWPPGPVFRLFRALNKRGSPPDEERPSCESPEARARWHRAGASRRALLLSLMLVQTAAAVHFMIAVLPYHGGQPIEMVILLLFALLFFWKIG